MGVEDLFDPPPTGGAQPLLYRQGIVTAFNAVTLQNTVNVGGTPCVDLPLLGVAEADTLTAGSVVGLMWTGTEYAIIGRLVRPNTAAATDAINRLANGTQSAQITTSEDTTSTSYVDLATVGPTVAITVKSSGKLLILVSCDMISSDTGAVGGGLMTVEVKDSAGNTIYGAGTLPALHFMFSDNAAHLVGDSLGALRGFLVQPGSGSYVVTAKYSAESSGALTSFANRNVTCIAL